MKQDKYNNEIEKNINLYFSDVFGISEEILDQYGAFNISVVTDLPLFIDPFLLFYSDKDTYQGLHDNMINYLRFLKKKSEEGLISPALIKSWYCFSEVKQNWLGFCESGNTGRGLGTNFAGALNKNLVIVFKNFGQEQITDGSHLEKLCLIRSGVGRDMISDFTTNLIKDYLLEYTQAFAQKFIDPELTKVVSVNRATFNYQVERWMPKQYRLPFYNDDYIILTPKDILTKDETWISHSDMVNNFREIPNAIDNDVLRAQINNYFYSKLPTEKEPTKEDITDAVDATLKQYPQLIDYYIKQKEDDGDQAVSISSSRVTDSYRLYVKQFGHLISLLNQLTEFYKIPGNTKEETCEKIKFFRDVIENKGGHRFFYLDGKPVRREKDIHILFRLTWHRSPFDVSCEVNDGRGPVDFEISKGSIDKTLVEFKLAANSQLRRNLEKQLDIYMSASDAQAGYKVIIYFTAEELLKVQKILKELHMEEDPNIYLIDARQDNKPSGSKA